MVATAATRSACAAETRRRTVDVAFIFRGGQQGTAGMGICMCVCNRFASRVSVSPLDGKNHTICRGRRLNKAVR
jgi:hypothetical protein